MSDEFPKSYHIRAFDYIKKMGIYKCNMQKIDDGDAKASSLLRIFTNNRLNCMEHSEIITTPNLVSLFATDYTTLYPVNSKLTSYPI